MISKTFEIRDSGTFIPVLATKLTPSCEGDRYLLARAGYGRTTESQSEYVMVTQLAGGSGRSTSDPWEWPGHRTMLAAHKHITENFDTLASGAVVDVQFVLGEVDKPKVSESEGL